MAEHDSNAILAEFLRRIDDGEQVDIDAVCEAHPEIAAELRSYVEGDEILAAMAGDDFEGDTSQPGAYDETVRPRGQGGTDIDLSGQKFGRYEVKRQLGQGAMGAVYLARDTQLDRDVALKIPKIGLVDKAEFIARFKREAQSAAKLNHPGICPVFDFGEVDGAPFITMAYVEGEPLSRFVGRKQVDNHWVADVVRKIAAALAHAHENGVIHRDLKSANVLVDRSGDPIVTDFGLAGRVDQDDEQTRITQVGAILGTPAYMSPEQIEGDSAQIGPPSDIYALGVILYELLAGELPFRGSMGSLIAQITRDDAKSPRKRNPDADQGLCELALQLLSKSPSKRPASMAEVAQQVDSLTIGAAQPKPVDKKTQRKLAKLEAGKQRIEELVQRGQFAQAVSILEKMANVQDHDSAKYAKWAKAEIERIKSLPKKLRDGAPHLLIAAQKLMAKHDYGQAAQILQQIPANLRSPEASKLLEDAIELQDEADLLLTDLKDCVATRTYDGIEDNVQRLLELKPGNKFARELWEALETYQRIPRAQRNYRFDNHGQLQPRDEGISRALLAGVGVAVVAFAAMAFGMKSYLAKPSSEAGKITVADQNPEREVAEPNAGSASETPKATPPEVVASDTAEQWTPLFNGRDFTGWRHYTGGEVTNGWDIRNGQLCIKPNDRVVVRDYPYDIVTSKTYSDFELEFEWMAPNGGNSGVMYRVDRGEKFAYETGIEYQVLEDPTSKDMTSPVRMPGSIYSLFGKPVPVKPRGVFNQSRIVAVGSRVEHWLNGQLVAEADMESDKWKQAVRNSKAAGWPRFMKLDRGYICLQNKGEVVCYRNLRIRELTSGDSVVQTASNAPDQFTYSRPVTELVTAGKPLNAYPWLSPDGLTIYWTSEGDGRDSETFQASRPSKFLPFTNKRKIAAGRIATVSPDGLEIIALAKETTNGVLALSTARRGSIRESFGRLQPIKQLSGLDRPKGSAFVGDGNELLVIAGIAGTQSSGIFRVTRVNRDTPWQSPKLVSIRGLASDMERVTHPSVTANGQHLLFSFVDSSKSGREWGAIADATDDPTVFVNPRPLLLDGERFITRGGRYCEATGELFYSHMDGEPPFREMEIRVADVVATSNGTGWNSLLTPTAIASAKPGWTQKPNGSLEYNAAGIGVQTVFAPTLPAAYEVDVDFTTNDDINQLGLTLPIANGLCQFMLFNNGPSPGGLESVDGQQFQQAAVQVSSQQLGDVSRNLRVSVDSTPQTTTIIARCDNTEVFRWSGNTNRLSLTNHWNHDQPGKLAIATGTAPKSVRAGRKGRCEITTLRWRSLVEPAGDVSNFPHSVSSGLSNIASQPLGPDGGFLRLKGTGESSVKVPGIRDFGNYEEFTVEGWVRPRVKQAGAKVVFSFATRAPSKGYWIGLSWSSSKLKPTWVVVWEGRGEDGYETIKHIGPPVRPKANQWTHIAMTQRNEKYSLYIDGKLVGQQSFTTAPERAFEAMRIGGIVNRGKGLWHQFAGDVDEVRVSRSVRYDGEFTPPNRLAEDVQTVGLYHCDDAGSRRLKDSSPRGYDGLLLNATQVDG